MPLAALAPVILPVLVPKVQLNVLETLADKGILVVEALQIASVEGVVTTGAGFTVTVIVKGMPAQPPVVETGVTIYSTVPAKVLLGFVSTWLMVLPQEEAQAVAPLMPPVMAPIDHVNVLAAEAVRLILVEVPLQIALVAAVVTAGLGFTVTVMVELLPTQLPVVEVGVTWYCTEPALLFDEFVRI